MNTNPHDVRHSPPPPAGVMGGEAALRPDRLPINSHCRAILSPEIPRTAGRRMMSNPSRAAHPFQTVEAVSHHPAKTPGRAEVVRGASRTLYKAMRGLLASYHVKIGHEGDVAEAARLSTGKTGAVLIWGVAAANRERGPMRKSP